MSTKGRATNVVDSTIVNAQNVTSRRPMMDVSSSVSSSARDLIIGFGNKHTSFSFSSIGIIVRNTAVLNRTFRRFHEIFIFGDFRRTVPIKGNGPRNGNIVWREFNRLDTNSYRKMTRVKTVRALFLHENTRRRTK